MAQISKGEPIQIPCKVTEGVFPGEVGITVDTATGPVSGFVREDAILRENSDSYIVGTVVDMDGDTVTVRLTGSFFTTTGIAYFEKNSISTALENA